MKKRVSVIGIDGSGKTTALRNARNKYGHDSKILQTLRVPQYYENESCRKPALSQAIESMGQWADEQKNILLKASALFLSMALYSENLRELELAYPSEILISERHPVIDSLAYSKFYSPYLKGAIDKSLEPSLREALGEAVFDLILSFSKEVGERWGGSKLSSFWELPSYIHSLFELKGSVLLEALKEVYNVSLPDQVIFLSVTKEALETRLRASKSRNKELHEDMNILLTLQESLRKEALPLKADVVETSNLNAAQVFPKIESLIFG